MKFEDRYLSSYFDKGPFHNLITTKGPEANNERI